MILNKNKSRVFTGRFTSYSSCRSSEIFSNFMVWYDVLEGKEDFLISDSYNNEKECNENFELYKSIADGILPISETEYKIIINENYMLRVILYDNKTPCDVYTIELYNKNILLYSELTLLDNIYYATHEAIQWWLYNKDIMDKINEE